MKVLIVYHCGLSDEMPAFYQEYAKQGVKLDVIAPSKSAVGKNESSSGWLAYDARHQGKSYDIIPVDLRNPISYGEGFKFFQLLKAVKKSKPDVIHVFDEYTSFYLAQVIFCRNILFGRKVPVLALVTQNLYFGPDELPSFVFSSLKKFLKRILRRIQYYSMFIFQKKYLDGAVGITQKSINRVKEIGVNIPQRLIFWGVDFKVFYPKDRNFCRKEMGIPGDIKLAGYIGRLDREKGVDKLIKAVSRIKDCYLLLPDYGALKEELDRLIDSLGLKDRIYRYKNVKHDKLADYYNCLDVFVLPSQSTPIWQEQYGRVLVEAMACHIPIVGSTSGEIPQVLNGYPKHLIFREESVDDLTEKVEKVQKLKIPDNFDLDKFLHKFSIENFVEESINFYKEFLSKV